MATWGVEARIKYRAWNTSTNAGVAGDSANHTLTLRRAGTDSAFVGTVNDLGGGVYEAVVSGTLAESYELAMRGTSTTADVVLFFESPVRTVKAAPTLTEISNQIEADHGAGSYVDTGTGLTASDVRDAIGLASANLDTQLGDIPTTPPLDATETQQAVEDALTTYDALKVGGDVNIVSVAGSAVSSVNDFKATSVLATNMITTLDVQNAAAAANNAYGAAKPGDSMVASNMVSEPLNATEVQQAAEDALTAYDAAKGTDSMNLSSTAIQAVRNDLERSGGVLESISTNQIDTTDVENATTSALTTYGVAKVSDIPSGSSNDPPVVSIDTSGSPWEMVYYDPSDGVSEIARRSLYTVDGIPITSTNQIVGQQMKV